MAKKLKKNPKIESWRDWYCMCGDLVKPLREYENTMMSYFKDIYNDDDSEVFDAYNRRHNTGFYNQESLVSSYKIKKAIKPALIGLGVGFLLFFILNLIQTSASDVVGSVVQGVIFGILGCLLTGGVCIGLGVGKTKRITSKLTSMEEMLKPYMKFIPNKYRNSYCVDYIFKSYGNVGDSLQLSALIENIDNEWFPSIDGTSSIYSAKAMSIMFDEQYKALGVDGAEYKPEKGKYEVDMNSKVMQNEDLPKDIVEKTFVGVDDADKQLNSLIGMKKVKQQVREMKNRMEFQRSGGGESKISSNHIAFLGSAGTGKALANSTPIAVADKRGYVPIADLKVGDYVFDENGKPTKVLGVYPQGTMPAHRVVFEDKSSLICNQEHIFAVRQTKAHMYNLPFEDMNVHQILNKGVRKCVTDASPNGRTKFWIPLNGALQRKEIDLPLDPYIVGVLLGDGCLSGNKQLIISSNDEGVVCEVANRLGARAEATSANNYNWHFICESKNLRPDLDKSCYITLGYMESVYDLPELWGKKSFEKRIPKQYLLGSYEQRLSLLQGLMDTGGSVSSDIRLRCTYSTTSKDLCDDVVLLVTSLGMRATVGEHKHGRYAKHNKYCVYIKCDHEIRSNLFFKSEKRQRCLYWLNKRHEYNPMTNKTYKDVGIYSIEKLDYDVPMTCIYVDSPSHLYQAGKQHIVTHNTTIARILTKILYDFGYIKENKCIEVDGSYFKSPYSGKTAARTNAIIDYALGGVLFIDEAYLMLDNNVAGTEATGALLKAMEDKRDDFVVIFAGYEDAVNRLIASNEGFASRIKYKVYFDDFTLDEMMEIFDLYMRTSCNGVSYTMSNDARELLKAQFDRERTAPMFGNARTVRNALDKILDVHADNYMSGKLNEGDKLNFVCDDVEKYVESRTDELAEDTRNYMASQGIDSSIISMSDLKAHTKAGSVDPDKDMQNLIGLGVVKDEVKRWKAQFDFYDGSMGENEGHHMLFIGSPGTGKSSMTKIMTGYLYKMGIIQRNEYIDVNGGFLKGSYVGHTEKRVEALIQYSQGAVLFIDEAYSVCNSSGDTDSYGQAAIDKLVDLMEKQRKNFVVILAGYDKEMNAFLSVNTGMKSRITHTFHFKDYSVHELAQIMQLYVKRDKFSVEKNAWIPIQQHIKVAKESSDNFGNARFARSYWEELKKAHILNVSEGKYDAKDKYVIKVEDVNNVE